MMGTWKFFILFSVLLVYVSNIPLKKLTQIQNNTSNKHLLSIPVADYVTIPNFLLSPSLP